MKLARLVTICFLAASLALFSGCLSKSYFFDFTEEPDLSRADGTWTTGSASYSLDEEDGLILKNIGAAAPHFYNGDFKVTWVFELGDTDTYHRSMYFYLGSEIGYPLPPDTDWYGGIAMADAQYSVGDYHFIYICNGFSTNITLSKPVDEIVVSPGLNTMVISKTGDTLSFSLNSVELGPDFTIEDYNQDWYCPQMLTFYEPASPWNLVVYKDFEVKYKGNQILTD